MIVPSSEQEYPNPAKTQTGSGVPWDPAPGDLAGISLFDFENVQHLIQPTTHRPLPGEFFLQNGGIVLQNCLEDWSILNRFD
jgi:hypothetical protein